jgi:hypothetical protein
MKTYTIRNKKTGKTKKVSEKDLHKYGIGGNINPQMDYGGMYNMGGLYAMGGYIPMAQDGVDMTVAPSMVQPVDQTQLPLRPGVAEQVPYTIKGEYSAKEAPVKKSTGPSKYSVVDYLNSMGLASDKESRKALAKKLGIKDYDFSAAKNTELLKLLKTNSKINTKIAEHQQYTFPESLSSDEMSTSVPFVGGHAEQPYEESKNVTVKTATKSSAKSPYWGGQYESKIAKELEGLSDRDLSTANNRTFFLFDPVKATALEKEMKRRGYKNWDDLVNNAYSTAPKIRATGAPMNFMTAQVPYFSNGGCMECGGKMEKGGPVSIKEIEKNAKWKPSDKKYVPLPPSPIIDYPPIHTIDKTLPPVPPQPFDYPVGRYLPGSYVQSPEYAMGGELEEAGDGKWIQKAINPAHKGYCTPMTKATCTPRRKALAKTLKKMAKSRKKEYGGYAEGGQYEMDDNQIAKLRAMGYKIKEV